MSLSPKPRTMAERRERAFALYLLGFTVCEIAERLGCTPLSVLRSVRAEAATHGPDVASRPTHHAPRRRAAATAASRAPAA